MYNEFIVMKIDEKRAVDRGAISHPPTNTDNLNEIEILLLYIIPFTMDLRLNQKDDEINERFEDDYQKCFFSSCSRS
jgi:hypothetical protein